eukprot:scaffold23525_cov21-Tisochrysis_lutea.AAC.1
MDPRSAYSPHYLKLAERYPELLLPYPAHGKATANSGGLKHRLSPDLKCNKDRTLRSLENYSGCLSLATL